MNKYEAIETLNDMVSELEAFDPYATAPNTINDAQENMADRLREVIEMLTDDCIETRVNPLSADPKPTKARRVYAYKRSEVFHNLDVELGDLSDHINDLEMELDHIKNTFGSIEVLVREDLLEI